MNIRRFRSDWETGKRVDRAFLDVGIERRTVFEVSDLETLLELVARDPAIAFVPEAIAEARSARSASTRSHKQNSAVVGYAAGDGPNHCPPDHAPKVCLQLLADTRRPDSSFQPIKAP
ncbi:LysR substrate-binding domain-containing protein [Mesorhizobium sp. AR07]|uniref:LysR substrate-binding domain-containing protein n=1 Tax=Mesorhizobium sp. AR07 TaxID=2865838 RepID=UPI0039B6F900